MKIESFIKDGWYGEISSESIESLQLQLKKESKEKEVFLIINELLKLGDFSVKNSLIQLMNEAENELVIKASIMLFCHIATNEDLLDLKNLRFLSDTSENNIFTFTASATETLSYHALPYLLALLEDYEETWIDKPIRDSICFMLEIYDDMYELSVEELGKYCSDIVKQNDSSKYFYRNELAFPGNLVKKLIPKVMIALKEKKALNIQSLPSLLSIWTGIKCPVGYETIITEEKYNELISYIEKLTNFNWIPGQKYFYGHTL